MELMFQNKRLKQYATFHWEQQRLRFNWQPRFADVRLEWNVTAGDFAVYVCQPAKLFIIFTAYCNTTHTCSARVVCALYLRVSGLPLTHCSFVWNAHKFSTLTSGHSWPNASCGCKTQRRRHVTKSTCRKNQATKEPEPARKFLKGSPNETKVPGSDEVWGEEKKIEGSKMQKQTSCNTVVNICLRSHVTGIIWLVPILRMEANDLTAPLRLHFPYR